MCPYKIFRGHLEIVGIYCVYGQAILYESRVPGGIKQKPIIINQNSAPGMRRFINRIILFSIPFYYKRPESAFNADIIEDSSEIFTNPFSSPERIGYFLFTVFIQDYTVNTVLIIFYIGGNPC